jgi:hypothetical protein
MGFSDGVSFVEIVQIVFLNWRIQQCLCVYVKYLTRAVCVELPTWCQVQSERRKKRDSCSDYAAGPDFALQQHRVLLYQQRACGF